MGLILPRMDEKKFFFPNFTVLHIGNFASAIVIFFSLVRETWRECSLKIYIFSTVAELSVASLAHEDHQPVNKEIVG